MILKCLIMGKGIIIVALLLLFCKLFDMIMNKVCKSKWKLLYDDFKNTLLQIIEWIMCLIVCGFCIVTIYYFFYIIGCLI